MSNMVRTICAAIQAGGHRLTTARLAIVDTLVASGGHISADDLVGLVHERQGGIGRMTVYRTLDLLGALGVVRPVYQGTGAAHYILLDDGHHHHLVCSQCERTIHFADCALQDVAREIGARYDFHIDSHLLEFYGVCADCRAPAGG